MYLSARLGTSRKIKGYEALADVVFGWKNDPKFHLEFRAPLSSAAVRILLWDGSFKAVPISADQSVKVVLKNLAEKIHSRKWWQLALQLVLSNGLKRTLPWDEKPLALLEADSEAKLVRAKINFKKRGKKEEEGEEESSQDAKTRREQVKPATFCELFS